MNGNDSSSALRLRSCRPIETANSQPMPGFRPWKAPSRASVMSSAPLMSVLPGRSQIGQDPSVHSPTRPAQAEPSCRCPEVSRVAVAVAGGVAALQPQLVDAPTAEGVALREEALVERDAAAVRVDVELGDPGADAVRIELLVPR